MQLVLETTPPMCEEMREGAREQRFDRIRAAAHKLKSNCMLVGAASLGQCLQDIETGAANQTLSNASAAVDSACLDIADFLHQVSAECTRRKTP